MCYLPSLIWDAVTFNRIGTNLSYYVEAAQTAARETGASRKTRIQFLASALDTLFYARRRLPHHSHVSLLRRGMDFIREMLPNKRLGRALCFYYLVIKVIYFANAVAQIIIMEQFLGMQGQHRFFGAQVLSDLWNGRYWQETLIFPRVGYCRVPIKLVGRNVPTLIAQCTMPVNMLNEKVYIFLWFWFVGVATLQAISISIWFLRLTVRKRRVRDLIRYLKIADAYDQGMRETLKRFEATCLRPDGTFLLYMMRLNAGDIITNEIIQALFERFIRHEKIASVTPLSEDLVSSPNGSPNVDADVEKAEEGVALKQRFVWKPLLSYLRFLYSFLSTQFLYLPKTQFIHNFFGCVMPTLYYLVCLCVLFSEVFPSLMRSSFDRPIERVDEIR